MNPRKTAVSLLLRQEADGTYVNLMLDASPPSMAASDRALLTALLYGVTERRLTLDYAIATFTKKPAEALSPHTRALLRLGLYQLYFMDKIPPFAAVAETVELAAHRGEAALLNAVLRRASREAMPLPPRERNLARYLSIAASFPLPTVRFFLSLYGEDEAERLLTAFNAEKKITLRVNDMKTTREGYMTALSERGVCAEATAYAPHGVRIAGKSPVRELYGYGDGLFYVQDEASQIAGEALSAEAGMRILDLCAAPGGKSMYAAIRARDRAEICARDLHESKLSLIADTARRLSLSSVRVEARDARFLSDADLGAYDAVICDVPCSGLGVFGKKPDLRYADIHTRFRELVPLQREILRAAVRAVRPGGVILYSTCTLNPAENGECVRAVLAAHPELSLEPFTVGELVTDGETTLLPHIHGTDGFYMARIRKALL